MWASALITMTQCYSPVSSFNKEGYEIANFHNPVLFSHHLILVPLFLCFPVWFFLPLF